MSIKLKPIDQQVLLITGATSETGLATVHMALAKGAKVYMVGKDEDKLQSIQDEMHYKELPTAYAVADISEIDQLQIAADHCIETFGTIDSWINIPEVSSYSRLLDVNEAEAKKIFDTNFWSIVNGCKVASDILRKTGGSIINVGTFVSDAEKPILSIYLASRTALTRYCESLKSETLAMMAPISVELFLPHPGDSSELMAKMILKRAAHYGFKEVTRKSWVKSAFVLTGLTLVFLKRKRII